MKALHAPLIITTKLSNHEEVVDTIYDALRAGVLIESILEDGFSFSDILDAIKVQPIVNEIVNDIPEFVKQIKTLDGEAAKKAVIEAKKRLETQAKLGKVTHFIINAIYGLSSSYDFALRSYEEGKTQIEMWDALISGKEVTPA